MTRRSSARFARPPKRLTRSGCSASRRWSGRGAVLGRRSPRGCGRVRTFRRARGVASDCAAMPRPTSIHVCSACGHETLPLGRAVPGLRRMEHAGRGGAGSAGPVGVGSRWRSAEGCRGGHAGRAARRRRGRAASVCRTGIGELDNVLGGGIVPGSLVLIGGAPGIGKSTLTTMVLANLHAAGRRDAVRVRRGVGRADPAARASACARGDAAESR